jgi:hypothetical protein
MAVNIGYKYWITVASGIEILCKDSYTKNRAMLPVIPLKNNTPLKFPQIEALYFLIK